MTHHPQSSAARRNALDAALAQVSLVEQVLSTAEGGSLDVHELLTDLNNLMADTHPAGSRGRAAQGLQFQVDSYLRKIDHAVDATRVESLHPLRGVTLRLTRIAGEPSFVLDSLATNHLGCPADGRLNTLGVGDRANLVTGDAALAQRIVAAALRQLDQFKARLTDFQSRVSHILRGLAVARENLDAADYAAQLPTLAAEMGHLDRAAAVAPRP